MLIALAVSACGPASPRSVAETPRADSLQLPVAPPASDEGTGSLSAYLVGVEQQVSGASSDSESQQDGTYNTLYLVSIEWGAAQSTRSSNLLLTDSSRVVLFGDEVIGDAAAKAHAVEGRLLESDVDPLSARVTYEKDAGGRIDESTEPPAVWHVVRELIVGR